MGTPRPEEKEKVLHGEVDTPEELQPLKKQSQSRGKMGGGRSHREGPCSPGVTTHAPAPPGGREKNPAVME